MTKTELTKSEKAILIFYLKGFLSDLSKALIFFIIFYILGLHKEFFYGIFFLTIFRMYSGGLHCKTYFGCLIISFVILSSGIALGSKLFFTKLISTTICILCGIITIIYTPILSKTRPALSKEAIYHAKVHVAFIILLFIIFQTYFKPNTYINIGFWILILHATQLVVARIRR